jgi:metal-dependent hydrolase (beta-lactamase superfamily II)
MPEAGRRLHDPDTGARRESLLDVGPDGAFADNAAIMGYDLSVVESLLLSHSHIDRFYGSI